MSTFGYVITALGTVVVAALAMLGSVIVARESRKATNRATEVARDGDELDGWRSLAKEYRERLEKIEARQESQEKSLRDERGRRELLSRQLDEERQRLSSIERRFRAAVAYIQRLLTILRDHDIDTPEPPEGLGDL